MHTSNSLPSILETNFKSEHGENSLTYNNRKLNMITYFYPAKNIHFGQLKLLTITIYFFIYTF